MKASGLLKLVFGLLLIIASVYAVVVWPNFRHSLLTLLQGAIPIIIFLIGLVFLLLGFED